MSAFFNILGEAAVKENWLKECTKETDLSNIDVQKLDKPFSAYDTENDAPTQDKNEVRDVSEDVEMVEGKEKAILTEDEKDKIKEETNWSDELIEVIGSMEEYAVYKEAGLQESEINGKKCLIQPDIDMKQKDSMGRTNKERMNLGLAPLNKNERPIELHHIGQHANSSLAELTMEQHRGKGNDTILHDKTKESEIDRNRFNLEKANHWKERTKQNYENESDY